MTILNSVSRSKGKAVSRESPDEQKKRAVSILKRLRRTYPDAGCALTYSSPFELLTATILSAQCTDERVNKVTPPLFRKFPDIESFAKADLQDLEDAVRTTGFYRNKAKNIRAAARQIVERHGGRVPRTQEELVRLPGVGRKTANVVLGNAFGIPGLTVDTHMIRLNRRLGLTRQTDPVKIEKELMPLVPRRHWTLYSHLIIFHGRRRCRARKPDCAGCEIRALCPSAE